MKMKGGFYNRLMEKNSTTPKVGKGATILMYSDRHAYEVLWVSEDKKRATIKRYSPERTDNNGMGDAQSYKYEKCDGPELSIVYRYRNWRIESEGIVFVDGFSFDKFSKEKAMELRNEIYGGGVHPQKVIEGITEKKKFYNTVSIIFGVKMEYYDFTF